MALKIKAEDAEERELMEIGQYPAKFTDYEEDEGQYGPYLKLEYKITDEDYEGRTISEIASLKLNPFTKLWGRIHALMGRPPEAGDEIDLDALLNRPVILSVGHKKTDDGRTFEQIKEVSPVRRKKKKAPAPQPSPEPEAVEEDDDDEFEVPF